MIEPDRPPAGGEPPLLLERAEWSALGRHTLRLRVVGRWRDRRVASPERPELLVPGETRPVRFPALPDRADASVGQVVGAPAWTASFAVPLELRDRTGAGLELRIGSWTIALPPAGPAPDERTGPEATVIGRGVLAERRARRAELSERDQSRRADEAEALAGELSLRVGRLEEDLARAADAQAELRAALHGRERELRAATQAAHAEQALRVEVEERHARESRGTEAELTRMRERLEHAEARVHELDSELQGERRVAAEAEQAAAAARAAQRRVQAHVDTAPEPRAAGCLGRPATLQRERALAAAARVPRPAPVPGPAQLDRVRRLAEAAGALAREAQRSLVSERAASAERERELRAELERALGGAAPPAPPPSAARASREPAIRPLPASPPPHAVPELAPERLSAALNRLRADAGEPASPPDPVRPWIGRSLHRLTAQDPDAAGRVLLGLLPALGRVASGPLAIDIALTGGATRAITVRDGHATVVVRDRPRLEAETDAVLATELATLARLATASRWRRRLPWRGARVRGRRRALRPVWTLVRAPLGLGDLLGTGVVLSPLGLLQLLAAGIDPSWTSGHRFVLAHQPPVASAPRTTVHVEDGRPLRVVVDPLGRPDATVSCSSRALLGALAGAAAGAEDPVEVTGDPAVLATLQEWASRLEHGAR